MENRLSMRRSAAMRSNGKFRQKEECWAYLMIMPQFIGLVCFILGPVLATLYLSFTSWDLISPPRWIGLQNYTSQLSSGVLAFLA